MRVLAKEQVWGPALRFEWAKTAYADWANWPAASRWLSGAHRKWNAMSKHCVEDAGAYQASTDGFDVLKFWLGR